MKDNGFFIERIVYLTTVFDIQYKTLTQSFHQIYKPNFFLENGQSKVKIGFSPSKQKNK